MIKLSRKLLLFLSLIIIVSCLVIPAFASTYTIPVTEEPVTVKVYGNDQLIFTYNSEKLTWKHFSENKKLTLYITNSVGVSQYRLLVNENYSSFFNTNTSSDYKLGTYGISINWEFLETNFSSIIPDDLNTDFIVLPKVDRNNYFYIINESEDDDNDIGAGLPEDSDGDKKKWYDYILNGIKKYLEALLEGIKDLFFPVDAISALKNLLSSFTVFIERFSQVTIQPFNDFLNNLNNGVFNYIGRIWDFPIIKDLTYGLIIIALVGGLFKLFITL